jgi:hypothetical protein
MSVVGYGAEVDAPPEGVWAVVADPWNLPNWERHIVAIEGVPAGGLEQGAGYTAVVRFMGIRTAVRCRVLEWDPPTWALILLSGILEAAVATRIDPLPGGRSRLRHEVDYHFRRNHLGELAAKSIRVVGGAHLLLRHGTLAQKRQIESGSS